MEYKCRVCDGHGEVDVGWTGPLIMKCGNCNGEGKVDWIRNTMPLYFSIKTGEWVQEE